MATMPPQAAAASQQGDFCRHGQLPRWHEDVGGEPLPFYVPLRKRLSVDGKSPAPRICIWECDGEAGDIICDIVAAPFRRRCSARTMQPPVPFFRMMTPPPPRPQRVLEEEEEARKPGKAIRKGHRSYGLMLNLQLGIRQCQLARPLSHFPLVIETLCHIDCWLVFLMRLFCGEKSSALPFKKLLALDFDSREKVWTRFPPEGSKFAPPHHSVDFR